MILFSKSLAAAAAAASMSTVAVQDPTVPVPPTPPQTPAQPNNLQISLVGDFRYNAMDSDSTVKRRLFMKELELGLAADVDPFLRAEAYVAFADDGTGATEAEVEEAFGRYNNLGRGLSAKFGKIAAAIGRVQRNHADQLNWMDFPLVTQSFLGEEGLRAGGLSFSYLFPGERFNELTIEALSPEDGPVFVGAHSGNPVFVGHYRTFFDFSEDASAQLGFTYGNGPSGVRNRRSTLAGVDLTYKFQPGGRGRALTVETEAYTAKSGAAGAPEAFGGFAALTYQLQPRLFGTIKHDYVEDPVVGGVTRAWTLGATLRVSEFHYWRAELQNISGSGMANRNVLNLQMQWLIGSHPAHKY